MRPGPAARGDNGADWPVEVLPLDITPMLRDPRGWPRVVRRVHVGDAALSRLLLGLIYAWQDAWIIPALPTITASGGALAAAS